MGKKKYLIEDYIGKKYNHLTVESSAGKKSPNGQELWNFKCDCGNCIVSNPYRVFIGQTKSCGCSYTRNRNRRKNLEHPNSKLEKSCEIEKTCKTNVARNYKGNIKGRTKNTEKLIGTKSGKLTVYGFKIGDKPQDTILYCKCDCGNLVETKINTFKYGMKKSCGCLKTGRKKSDTFHKKSDSRLYGKYWNMRRRCYDKTYKCYHRYGGRGIKVCEEWLNDSGAFVRWAILNGALDKTLTLDRIDNDGDYCPENCRFVSMKEQNRNVSRNRILEFNGEKHCVAEWIEITGIPESTFRSRLSLGWDIEKILNTPIRERRKSKLDKPIESN